jgi:hypothetical protein
LNLTLGMGARIRPVRRLLSFASLELDLLQRSDFYFKTSCFLSRSSRTAVLNSTSQLLARDPCAVAQGLRSWLIRVSIGIRSCNTARILSRISSCLSLRLTVAQCTPNDTGLFQPFHRCARFQPFKPIRSSFTFAQVRPAVQRRAEKLCRRRCRSRSAGRPPPISTDLKDFLPRFLVLRKFSHVVDGQHVRRRRPDFFQRFHFGVSRSFTRLSINLLSFFTDGPAYPE